MNQPHDAYPLRDALSHGEGRPDSAAIAFRRARPSTQSIPNFKNYFGYVIARLLKNFSIIFDEMSSSANEQALCLPIRNFVADDLEKIVEICKNHNAVGNFSRELQPQLTKLKNRKSPRRNSNYGDTHFVDNDKKYFQYGKERHSRVQTGAPHSRHCGLNANFRFGKRIASDRHYNVTRVLREETKISGDFRNCHDESITVQETSHLNMFSNGYF
ncbi:hypothetical protein ACAX43_25555 [Paraburkholderia sp. IW21]|uniref:hypothetical protein n=1 Tax=Paraburkholderia sp. IW21 TaxID=3242488 RepID=UPI00351FE89F